jgi:hypothetical protein
MALKMSIPSPTVMKSGLVDYSQQFKEEVGKPVTATTTVEKKKGLDAEYEQVSATSETLNPALLVSKMHYFRVGVEGGRTINLGHYNSARIGVTISVPCDPENLEDAYEYASDWISGKIKEVEDGIAAKSV